MENIKYGSINIIYNDDDVVENIMNLFTDTVITIKDIVVYFDMNEYKIHVKDIVSDKNIHFEKSNDYYATLPLNIYKKEKSNYQNYYSLIKSNLLEKNLKNLFRNNQNFNTNNISVSKYNCVYTKLLNVNNLIFGVVKIKYGNRYLFAYNELELNNKNEILTIIKHIFDK
jgi:hypothetical protein